MTSDLRASDDRPSGRGTALALGALAAVLFAATAGIRLTAQGLQYDELHQATAAFAWCGRPTPFFVSARWLGLPVLNMSYSGAIKSAVYGLYLRASGLPFTPWSWRALGIGFVAAGLLALPWIARRRPPRLLALLLVLLLSDADILLQVRHDWGPSALALLLRLLFAAVWLRASGRERPAHGHAFVLGLLTGVAVFEKLSSLVLVVPLAILVLGDRRFRDRTRLAWCAGGLLLGLAPVLALNARSLVAEGTPISLRDTTGFLPSLSRLDKAWGYVSLAAGREASAFDLGTQVPLACTWIEGACVLAAAALCFARRPRPGTDAAPRAARAFVACWVAVGAGLACLPNDEVWFHHWIVGTPFLYVAIALLLAGPGEPARATDTRRRALGVVVGVLLVNRLVVMGLLVGWLADGRASRGFDPELDRLGRFAARQGDDVTFVAATWGIATQVFCWSNAREGVVSEPFWSYTGPEQLQPVLQGRRAFYLLSTVPLSDVTPESSRRILRDATTLADWTQAPVDAELAGLRTVLVTKHVRSAEGPPPLR